MGEIRRGFSVTVVRGAAMCLLERLAHLAPGARAVHPPSGGDEEARE